MTIQCCIKIQAQPKFIKTQVSQLSTARVLAQYCTSPTLVLEFVSSFEFNGESGDWHVQCIGRNSIGPGAVCWKGKHSTSISLYQFLLLCWATFWFLLITQTLVNTSTVLKSLHSLQCLPAIKLPLLRLPFGTKLDNSLGPNLTLMYSVPKITSNISQLLSKECLAASFTEVVFSPLDGILLGIPHQGLEFLTIFSFFFLIQTNADIFCFQSLVYVTSWYKWYLVMMYLQMSLNKNKIAFNLPVHMLFYTIQNSMIPRFKISKQKLVLFINNN